MKKILIFILFSLSTSLFAEIDREYLIVKIGETIEEIEKQQEIDEGFLGFFDWVDQEKPLNLSWRDEEWIENFIKKAIKEDNISTEDAWGFLIGYKAWISLINDASKATKSENPEKILKWIRSHFDKQAKKLKEYPF